MRSTVSLQQSEMRRKCCSKSFPVFRFSQPFVVICLKSPVNLQFPVDSFKKAERKFKCEVSREDLTNEDTTMAKVTMVMKIAVLAFFSNLINQSASNPTGQR